jgi:hypothetical protein
MDVGDSVVEALIRDLRVTVGAGLESMVRETAGLQRRLSDTAGEYQRRVVEDVQQRLHDEFIDTSSPSCPIHGRHPLWLSDGWWRCGTTAVARLGELRPPV